MSSYDVLSLINMRKLLSLTTRQTFTLNSKSYELDQIQYRTISDDFLKIEKVILGGKEFEVGLKSLSYFYETLTELLDEKDLPLKFVHLAVYLGYQSKPNQVLSAIKNATHDEITLLEYLYRNCLGHMQVKNGEGEAVGLFESTADLFPFIFENNGVPADKIIVREELPS